MLATAVVMALAASSIEPHHEANAAIPAECYLAGGVGTNWFNVKITGSQNPTWTGYLDHGRTIWNATHSTTGTAIGVTSGNGKTISRGSLDPGVLGSYAWSGTRASRTFHITIDSTQIIDTPGRVASVGAWAKFVSMHEMGHALSLKDNPSTTQATAMKYRPITWTSPYQSTLKYDRTCVAAHY